MKIFKSVFLTVCAILLILTMTSCSAEGLDGGSGGGFGGMFGGGFPAGAPSADKNTLSKPEIMPSDSPSSGGVTDDTDMGSDKGESSPPEEVLVPAGQMTASAWCDNDNYLAWCELFSQGSESNGKFYGFHGENTWGFNSLYRVKVTLMSDEEPVSGAEVVARAEDGRVLFKAVTDTSGVAYIFTGEHSGIVTATVGGSESVGSFSHEQREITLTTDGTEESKNVIEIMFVIDVTGSMGDELHYVEAEISDVIKRVAAQNSDAVINLALLFYRDYTDKEEFAYHDFVNVTDPSGLGLSKVISALSAQTASGGGDYPEAVDEALAIAVSKQWSDGSTKLLFHVLDAPPHEGETNRSTYKAAVDRAAELGIRICPILCSGADTLTEYVTRQSAIYTGGTFIFVTDDSGIGGSHYDPSLPNVTVEFLNSLLVRIINGYHTGEFAEPIDWRQEVKTN